MDAWRTSAAIAVVGGGAALYISQVRRHRELPCNQCEVKVVEWLQANKLSEYILGFAQHGYDELEVLADLSPAEVEELILAVRPRAGHVAKLRRCLVALRAALREAALRERQDDECATSRRQSSVLEAEEGARLPQDAGVAAAEDTLLAAQAPSAQEVVEAAADGNEEPAAAPASPSEGADGESHATAPGFGLYPGARVVLFGLEKRPDLNGKTGTISGWDPQTGRWTFTQDGDAEGGAPQAANSSDAASSARTRSGQSSNGRVIRVRAENLRLSEGASAPSLQIPNEFRCCITQELMERPVITSDGHTYERSAIARWLEERSTSPKTGRELPDRVLRPNHSLRTQILAWREANNLPPLPPWEPEPQETVQQQTQPAAGTGAEEGVLRTVFGTVSGATATMQTLSGSVTFPLTFVRPHVDEASLLRVLHASPALREEVLAAMRDIGGNGAQSPSLQEVPRVVMRNPRLMEIVLRMAQQDPEVRAQLSPATPNVAGGPDRVGAQSLTTETPLFRAVREGDCGVVEQLLGLQRGVDGDRIARELSAQGDTLLHVACWFGHQRLVSMLIARGHPVHVPSRNRSMPLHYAAFRGHLDVVGTLLGAQADTERKMMGGDTAIHQAAWSGHLPVLNLLLESRASVMSEKDNGDSALALAAVKQHVSICSALIACIQRSADAKDALNARNAIGRTVIHNAASVGNVEIVKMLLDAEAEPDVRSDNEESPLHLAVESGDASVCRLLLERRVEVDALRPDDDHTALGMAVLQGKAALVELLVQHGASLSANRRRDGMTVVHMAVIFMASQPSQEGADRHAVLTALAEARASLDAKARNGLSPVHLALVRFPQPAPHRSSALRALLECRADVELPLRGGERPIHLAVGSSLRIETALLIEHRADVNARSSSGETPLHHVARQGSRECAELLLRAGANRHLCDFSGHTAADVARQYGQLPMEQFLRQLSYPSQPPPHTSAEQPSVAL